MHISLLSLRNFGFRFFFLNCFELGSQILGGLRRLENLGLAKGTVKRFMVPGIVRRKNHFFFFALEFMELLSPPLHGDVLGLFQISRMHMVFGKGLLRDGHHFLNKDMYFSEWVLWHLVPIIGQQHLIILGPVLLGL
jgi:hypothetical protein